MSTQIRPTGVTIIAVLEIISGIVAIAFGVSVGLMGSMGSMGSMSGLGVIIGALGWVVVVIGIVSFILAYGLLKGKSWAWNATLIFTIISLVFDLLSMNVIGLIIDIVILYYLFRPHVKAFFGKSEQVL